MWNKVNQNRFNAYLTFLVWPFFSLLFSFANYRSSFAKNILWLFIVFFGFTFVIGTEGSDANYYRDELVSYHEMDIDLLSFVNDVSEGKTGRGDYLQPVLTYVISRFTSDQRVLFMSFAFIMGFFYSRNIWFLIENSKSSIKPYALPFLLFFSLIIPFWLINGFRFWTAAHIFVYGAFRVLKDNNKKYLILTTSTILVHIGFIFPAILLPLFILIGNRIYLYIPLFLISIFLLKVDIPTILNIIPQSESVANERLGQYASEVYVKKIEKLELKSAWFIKLKKDAIIYLSYFIIIVTSIFYRKQIRRHQLNSLFLFGVVLMTVTNILSIIPSMGRFFALAQLFIFSTIFMLVQASNLTKSLQKALPILILPMLLYSLVELRIALDFFGIGTFIANPLVAPFFDYLTPLIDYIK